VIFMVASSDFAAIVSSRLARAPDRAESKESS
jgi:hypothetical protein